MTEDNNLFEKDDCQSDCAPANTGASQYYYSGAYTPPQAPSYTVPMATPIRVSGTTRASGRQKIGVGKLIAVFAIVIVLSIVLGAVGGYFAARTVPSEVDRKSVV